jgi:hypothetical protein
MANVRDRNMKRIFSIAGIIVALVGGTVLGYMCGNHHASSQALNELSMISGSAYDATTNPVAKRVFVTHMCSVLTRKVQNMENPFALFRQTPISPPTVRPNGSFRGLPQKANSLQ